jgi:hypothetical protein
MDDIVVKSDAPYSKLHLSGFDLCPFFPAAAYIYERFKQFVQFFQGVGSRRNVVTGHCKSMSQSVRISIRIQQTVAVGS